MGLYFLYCKEDNSFTVVERKEVEKVLQNACKCKNVSVEEVAQAVKNGADTVEKVMEATGAGSGCGRCKAGVIPSIIENKKTLI